METEREMAASFASMRTTTKGQGMHAHNQPQVMQQAHELHSVGGDPLRYTPNILTSAKTNARSPHPSSPLKATGTVT